MVITDDADSSEGSILGNHIDRRSTLSDRIRSPELRGGDAEGDAAEETAAAQTSEDDHSFGLSFVDFNVGPASALGPLPFVDLSIGPASALGPLATSESSDLMPSDLTGHITSSDARIIRRPRGVFDMICSVAILAKIKISFV